MKNLQKKIQLLLNLYKSKNLTKAELLNKELIIAHPKVVVLYNIMGLILTEKNKIDEAIECYESGIKIKADYAMIYNNLGSIYASKKEYTKAESYYKKSIDLDKKIPEPYNNLGSLYLTLKKHKKAIPCFKSAINIDPKFFVAHYNLGIVYKNTGKFKEAKKYLTESVKLNSNFYTAHRTLSELTKYTERDNHFIFLKKLYENTTINKNYRAELAFALGKACHDFKDFSEAFRYLYEGNELRRANINFSLKKEKEEFANIKKIFNENFFSKFENFGSPDSTAIFILGMPRSGTTLVEQILSNHPNVFGGEELDFLTDLIKKNFHDKNQNIFLKDINNINKGTSLKIGNEYVNNLKKISNNFERVTDKLPINFKWIGIIKLILPNSKIVHCFRNPKDNCLSIFKNYFINKKLNFAYNLEEISGFYILYNELMEHWKSKLPGFIIDIKYEELIGDPEKQIRNLLKACNLTWNDKCLKFHNNQRPITTSSDTQVRKKIYKNSIDSWKNYENYLKDSFQALSN